MGRREGCLLNGKFSTGASWPASVGSECSSPNGLGKVSMTKVTTATAVADEQSGHYLESQHTGQENYSFEASLCI